MPARLIGPRRPGGAFYKKRPSVRNPRPRAGKVLTAAIKKVVKSQAEKKFMNSNQTYRSNSGINVGDLVGVIPAISQGVDDFNRIGDKIRPTSLIVKVTLCNDNSAYATHNVPPFTARVFVLSQKNIKSLTGLSGVATGSLLRLSGTEIAYLGGTGDNMLPINRDLFTVHGDRKVHFAGQSITGVTQTWTQSNKAVSMTFRVKCPASFTYDDAISTTLPVNFAPFLAVGYQYDDGQVPDLVNTNLRVQVEYSVSYTDA